MANKQRGALLTIAAGDHADFVELGAASRAAFCHHNELANIVVSNPPDTGRPVSWAKIPLITGLLSQYDVVLALDADAVIVRSKVSIKGLVTRVRPIAMVAHKYMSQTVPNLGMFAVQRSHLVSRLLLKMWEQEDLIHHKWWENAAFLRLAGYDISSEPISKVRRTTLDLRTNWLNGQWNSIPIAPVDNQIIKHYPGMSYDDRICRIKQDVEDWKRSGCP